MKTIRQSSPDVVHFQSCYNLWIAAFVPLVSSGLVVTTLHDVEPHLGYERFDKVLARRLHLRYSDGFMVQCGKERRKLRRLETRKPKFVIPHGNYGFFRDFEKDDVPTEDLILFFGNIAEYKGLSYLLRAAPQIEQEHPEATILVAGRGDLDPYRELLERTDNVRVRNEFIPKEEVAELFQRAKVVALPYVEATQSDIIPIAYEFENPVVATRTGCIPEAVDHGETGFLIPPRDTDALGDALVEVLRDESMVTRMGENAHAKKETEMSWETIAEQTIEAYRETM